MLALNPSDSPSGNEALPNDIEPLESMIYAWLKRLPPHLHPALDYQLQNLPARYFQSLDIEGVQTDLILIEKLKTERTIVDAGDIEGKTMLRVLVARDEPRIFLRVVAVLAAHQIAIERALIFTGHKDGVVIDHFVLRRVADAKKLEHAVQKIRESLITGYCEMPALPKPIHAGMRIKVENHHGHDHTAVTVFANDQGSFLLRIARVFAELRVQLQYASLKTQGDQIIDSFHVQTQAGLPLSLQEEICLRDAIHRAFVS